MSKKADLRLKYKAMRRELSDLKITQLSALIADKVIESGVLDGREYIHIFLSIVKHREVDTRELISALQNEGKKIVVSSWDADSGCMSHFLLEENAQFIEGSFGVPKPVGDLQMVNVADIDAVIIPLLAFDRRAHRVGYGRGVYDDFLARCRKDVKKIGISFFEVEDEPIDDVRDDDQKLDFCVTPDNMYF